jgi:hypothetical protein
MLNEFANNPDIEHCIYMDGDIAVYKDFVPDILERLQQDNLLFQCDEKDRNLVCESSVCPNVCTGFIAWNHGHDGGVFKLNDKDLWLKYPEDQLWVNNKLGLNSVPFRTLPRSLYPNGTFVSLIEPKKDSYILHYNYRVGKNKKTDMKIFGDWHIII